MDKTPILMDKSTIISLACVRCMPFYRLGSHLIDKALSPTIPTVVKDCNVADFDLNGRNCIAYTIIIIFNTVL